MHTSRMKIITVGICLLVGLAAPATADLTYPEEWIGDWEWHEVVYDCISGNEVSDSTGFGTICSDSVFDDPGSGDFASVCSATADATSYTAYCTISGEAFPGCMVTGFSDVTMTRSGDSFTMTATTSISFVGDCEISLDFCHRIETTAIRVSSTPGPCGSTPTENMSWGTVKSVYR